MRIGERTVLLGVVFLVLLALGTTVPVAAARPAPAGTNRAVVVSSPLRAVPAGASNAGATTSSTKPRCSAGLVALTFDDGPARGLTAKLVGILQQHHVPATVFMVGSRVHTAPGAARRVARAGFTIGNHTWSHPDLRHLSDAAIRSELRRTARELRLAGIRPGTLMRPPYGDVDARVRAEIHALGLVPVLWTVDSGDWRGGSPRQIAASILAQLHPHGTNIVLQHDGVTNSPASVAAVPQVIRTARRRGYCFAGLGPHGHPVLPGASPGTTERPVGVPAGFDVTARLPFGAVATS